MNAHDCVARRMLLKAGGNYRVTQEAPTNQAYQYAFIYIYIHTALTVLHFLVFGTVCSTEQLNLCC